MRNYYGLTLFLLLLFPASLFAATQFISDKIYMDTYAQPDEKSEIAFSILSGTAIELIRVEGEYSNIKNRAGETGWIRNKFLSTEKPAQIAYLQTRKKYDAALVKIRKLQSTQGKSKDSAKTLKALNKTRKKLAALTEEHVELEKSLSVRTDSLNKSIGAINVLTEQIHELKEINSGGTVTDDGTLMRNTTQAGLFPFSPVWTVVAVLLAVLLALGIGFTFGWKGLERKISKRHGGVNIY
ncbi:MAG: hypothetical protein ACC707_01395 [Thiohalomonadales bacterium]